MKLKITIDMTNAAFRDDQGQASRILRQVARELDGGASAGYRISLYDINGNRCGTAEVTK